MTARQKRGMLTALLGLCMVFASLGLHLTQEKQDALAGENAQVLLQQLQLSHPSAPVPEEVPQGITAMPEKAYLGYSMIGTLRVETLGMELPVLSTWDENLLEVAPCRYSGSIPEKNMVLMGHNYKSIFTPLHHITVGTAVEFEDVNGVIYHYAVAAIEFVYETHVEKLASEYPLTLFTCTSGGQSRVLVRCIEV